MMDKVLQLLSGGAAQGLVGQLAPRFSQSHGLEVRGTFGAVGAMRDKLLAGEACDILILTQSLVEQLAQDGHVDAGSITPLGVVKTGIAVKIGEATPNIDGAAELKAALLRAPAIYFPDPEKATAGIHFMKVLRALGIDRELASGIRTFPNGATAMGEMAKSPERGVIGCTQVTEILYTPGVQLAGLLPPGFELATVYAACVCTKAQQPQAARDFIRLLSGEGAAAVRASCGFEVSSRT
jgi:molybdate transport system substrate-binding protein